MTIVAKSYVTRVIEVIEVIIDAEVAYEVGQDFLGKPYAWTRPPRYAKLPAWIPMI